MTDLEELKKRLHDHVSYWTPDSHVPIDDVEEAVDAIQQLQRENEVLRHERDQARAQRDFGVKMLTRIHSFISPEDVTMPDGRRFEFNNPAIEHEMLRTLSEAIRAIPEELKKAETQQPNEAW